MNNNFITFILGILIIGLLGGMIFFGINAFVQMGIVYENQDVANREVQVASIEKKEDISTPQVVEKKIDNVSDTFPANVEYKSSASRTHYFYSQLDSYSKKIYDGLEANIDNMKSGTHNIEFGDAFSSLLSKEDGQNELGDYYQSAIEAFTYDNPEVFFLDPTKMFLNIQTTTKGNNKTYNVYITNAEGAKYLANGFYSKEQIEQCQAQIEQVKNEVMAGVSGNTENKIKYIHDYIVDNLSYDETISKDNIYNLYGALANKECVCEGYAKALKYLLDEAGVDNVIVIGTGTNSKGQTENHAWNYAAIDGNWYAIDSTWDDPVIQGWGGGSSSKYKYKYYLKGSQTMEKDHTPNGQFTTGGKIFKYPVLSESDY